MGNQSSTVRGPSTGQSSSSKALNASHKRKSLDLPDLAALNLNIQPRPKTQSIPIPGQRTERDNEASTISILQPYTPAPPPPSRNQSLDKLLLSGLPPPVKLEKSTAKPVNVKISWNGGGNRVFLARAGDDDWKGRKLMHRESTTSHSITIPLLPGTHHLRFLVDDQWLVADDLPTAVDDQGSLANYVGVALDGLVTGGMVDAVAAQRPKLTPGHSFWSNSSSTGEEDDGSYRYRAIGNKKEKTTTAFWTSDIPPELEEAARQEELFIQATNAQTQNVQAVQQHPSSSNSNQRERGRDRGHGHTPSRAGGQTQIINGFIPPPAIPHAPNLPRQLDKLILNVHSYPKSVTANGTVVGATGGARRDRDRECRDKEKDNTIGRKSGRNRERKSLNLKSPSLPEGNEAPVTPINNGHSTHSSPTIDQTAVPEISISSSPTSSPTASTQNTPKIPTIPTNDTVSADDTSVLPVPSHVVLHHLTTSAIRNGVLAVGCTVRYRKKYLTTIYYKPT